MPKIHADFVKMIDARKAIDALKAAGYTNAHIDAIDGFMEEYSAEINPAGTAKAPSLSGLVHKSAGHITDVSKAPLVAASPMISGMGSFAEISDNLTTRLRVTVPEDKVDEVRAMLKDLGSKDDMGYF